MSEKGKEMEDESTLIITRTIKAGKEKIFKALVDQTLVKQWFYAGEEGWAADVSTDPKPGGQFHIEMKSPQGSYPHDGVYKEIIPNQKIVFTWNSKAVTDTLVTISLREVEGGTEVTLKHEFMPNEEMKKNHTRGWIQILANLENIVIR